MLRCSRRRQPRVGAAHSAARPTVGPSCAPPRGPRSTSTAPARRGVGAIKCGCIRTERIFRGVKGDSVRINYMQI
eukprot:scaffold80203_cov73-Phaeocystis_antarctica.AAC.3